MSNLTIFGGRGFVGSEFAKLQTYPIIPLREDYNCYTTDVVNFISTVDNYNVHTDPLLDINTNLVVLMKILENFKRANTGGCFNFISSWFVYGKDSGFGEGSRGISEEETCDPKGFYSITKRTAEQLLVSYCETFNINYRILRLSNVIGKNDQKVSAKKNALQYLLSEIKKNNDINLYDMGYFYRDFIDSRDCARAIDLVIKNGELNSIYNIGNGDPIVFLDVLQHARDKINSTSKFIEIEQKEFHKKVQSSRSFYMDTTKLKSLGYAPKYNIFETVEDIISPITK